MKNLVLCDVRRFAGDGYDFMDEEENAIEEVCKAHALRGTTVQAGILLVDAVTMLEEIPARTIGR